MKVVDRQKTFSKGVGSPRHELVYGIARKFQFCVEVQCFQSWYVGGLLFPRLERFATLLVKLLMLKRITKEEKKR